MMRRRLAWVITAAAAAGAAVVWTSASGVGAQTAPADIRAEYERAASLRDRTQGLAIDVAEAPTWLEGTSKFWYRKSVAGGSSFVLVDAAAASKGPAFDHARLAAASAAAANGKYTAVTLPFNTFQYVENQQGIELAIGLGAAATRWRCTLSAYDCTRVTGAPAGGGQGRGGGGGTSGAAPAAARGRGATPRPPPGKKKFSGVLSATTPL